MVKKTKKGNSSGSDVDRGQQVALLLQKEMSERGYPDPVIDMAVRVWEIFFVSEQPQVRSSEAYAAAVEYTVIHMHVMGVDLTQKDVASRYGTTAASVSRISQLVVEFLSTIPMEEYVPQEMFETGFSHDQIPGWDDDDEPVPMDELVPPAIFDMIKNLPRTSETWIGGRRTLNIYVTDPVPRRPDVILWADASGHPVLGQMVIEAEAPPVFIIPALIRTMLEPAVGQARRPQRLSVGNEALVTLLKNVLGPLDIEVKFGAAPVLDALVTLLETHLNTPGKDDPPESYTMAGRIPAEEVERFFEAAAHLYRKAPWEFVYDSQVLAVDLDRWGFERATVSILGAAKQTFGLLVFQDAESFISLEVLSQAREHTQAEKLTPPAIDIMAIEFERGADLAPSMRQEILQHGWEVAEAKAHPTLQCIESYRLVRPNTSQDLRAATALAYAVAEFTHHYRPLFAKRAPKPTRMKIDLPMFDEKTHATVTYPHPDYLRLRRKLGS